MEKQGYRAQDDSREVEHYFWSTGCLVKICVNIDVTMVYCLGSFNFLIILTQAVHHTYEVIDHYHDFRIYIYKQLSNFVILALIEVGSVGKLNQLYSSRKKCTCVEYQIFFFLSCLYFFVKKKKKHDNFRFSIKE